VSNQGTKSKCYHCNTFPKHEVVIATKTDPVTYYSCDAHIDHLRAALEKVGAQNIIKSGAS
jgi:hypothetical protein